MGVLFELGKHKITAEDRKKICNCWTGFLPRFAKPPGCKYDGCFLARTEKWAAMSDEEQLADDKRRSAYAKAAVAAIRQALDILTEMRHAIRDAETNS
jgi:hypothetical protein